MKKSLIILLACSALLLVSCKNEQKDDAKTEQANVSEDTKKETKDDFETGTNKKDETKDIDDANENWLSDAEISDEISEDEKDWILNVSKIIDKKDKDAMNEIIGGGAKTFVDSNPNILDEALMPLNVSGKINRIISVDKTIGKDTDGSTAYLYNVLCEGEKDNVYMSIARNDSDELVAIRLNIADVVDNQDELKTKYKSTIEKAYEIIKLIKDDKYDEFIKEAENVNATEEEIKHIYDIAFEGFKTCGEILSDDYIVAENQMKDIIETDKEGLLIQVYIRIKSKNYTTMDFTMFFDEDNNLLVINYNRVK